MRKRQKKVEPLTELEGTNSLAGNDHKQDSMILNVWCSWHLQLSNYKIQLTTLIPIERFSFSIKAFSMIFLLLDFLMRLKCESECYRESVLCLCDS